MISKVIRKGTEIFSSEQHTILSAASVIGGIYGISAILGFIKNRVLSASFGDSPELGIFFAADDIPSLIFLLVISGSLSAAFIPVFNKYYKRNVSEAWHVASGVLNISLLILFVLGLFVFIFAEPFSRLLSWGSDLSYEELKLMANLMRIMMLAQFFLIISAIMASVLQSFSRFVLPAFAPVMYNLGIIIFILLFVDRFDIYAPAMGMVFGALLHVGIQIPLAIKMGFRYSKKFDFRNRGVVEIYRLMIPRALGQTVQNLLSPLYTNLALFISAPSNVILTFAFAIQTLPVRVFGMSIGQAALPMLSKASTERDVSKYKKLLVETIHQVIFLVLPISILIFVLRIPLVRLAVGARKYSWEATVMTSYTLAFFSISLVMQSLVIILSKAFYSICDTKTPVKISLFSIVFNVLLAFLFVKWIGLGVWSLGLAFALGSILNGFLLFVSLIKRIGGFSFVDILDPINRIGFASFMMGLGLYIPLKMMDVVVIDTTKTVGLILLTGTVSIIGFITYIGLAKFLKIRELDIIWHFTARVVSLLIVKPPRKVVK